MDYNETATLIELISSKICHDIISPVGAVANGIEIMEEMGADDDVINLISFSSAQANAKLNLLRMAYGIGGADNSIKIDVIHKTFNDFISGDKRITQDWDKYLDIGFEPNAGFQKLFICCLIMASESLPKGGVISVDTGDENTIVITGKGENANISNEFIENFKHEKPISELNPKLAHPYITGIFAKKYGYNISLENIDTNIISLKLKQSYIH